MTRSFSRWRTPRIVSASWTARSSDRPAGTTIVSSPPRTASMSASEPSSSLLSAPRALSERLRNSCPGLGSPTNDSRMLTRFIYASYPRREGLDGAGRALPKRELWGGGDEALLGFGVLGSGEGELSADELGVGTVAQDELVVGALLGNAPAVEDDDAVGVAHGGEAVGDD